MEGRQHLLRESSSAGLRRRQKWRFCRAQMVRVWTPTFAAANIFVGHGDFNSRLVTVIYYETRTSLTGRRYFMWAQIFYGRKHFMGRYFMGANISWARIFHGREYFMGANISWARIFHGREYFVGANISWALIF
jgi:hypothetical protein